MRLIDDKDCKDLLYVRCIGHDKAFIAAMEQVIDDCPAIDAVEVVRCKDCIYWSNDGRCEPTENGLVMEYTTGLDFCSYGKRRKENNV